jgi:hypothetical protein
MTNYIGPIGEPFSWRDPKHGGFPREKKKEQADMNEDNWKISLLGTRRTGKTVYLGGLYQYYGDTDNEINDTPFYVYAPDSLSRGRLEAYARGISEIPPDFPDGTFGIEPFPIEFNLETSAQGSGRVLKRTLSLIDHEGAALKGSKDQENAQRYDDVISDLKSFDAFIGFLSSEHLMKDSAARDADWQTMRSIISDVADKLDQNDKLPVAIVLAKHDLAEAAGQEEEVMDRARKMVAKLSESIPNATFMICPTNVVRTDGNNGWESDARPTNIAAPFLFSTSGVVIRNAFLFSEKAKEELRNSAYQTQKIEERKREMRGFWGWIKRSVLNTGSRVERFVYDQRAKRNTRIAQDDIVFAQAAFETLTQLADERGICFIYKGQVLSSDKFRNEIMRLSGVYA